jgi:hypothetical protein
MCRGKEEGGGVEEEEKEGKDASEVILSPSKSYENARGTS